MRGRAAAMVSGFISGLLGVLAGVLLVGWLRWAPGTEFQWPVSRIVAQVGPAVVMVVNHQGTPPQDKVKGIGSGVIVDSQGDIVTNYHVVAGASRLSVKLQDGATYAATVVGTDPPTDLAVLRIHPRHPLKPVAFAPSSGIQPGDLVVAIGNSLGLRHSVTVGVISARERVLYKDGWEFHLIQTDAAINPGNSGGPLLNLKGQLIGINSSKIAQAGVEGIGFAIPSDTVQDVVQQILRYGQVRRPWLGLTVASAGPGGAGLLVVTVAPRSPASEAGIQPGDLLVALDGKPLHTLNQLVDSVSALRVGSKVPVQFWRQGEVRTAILTVGWMPNPTQAGTAG